MSEHRKYPVHRFTRIAFPPRVADLSAPTLEEIGQAAEDDYYLDVYTDEYIGSTTWIYDIQHELAALPSLGKSTVTVNSTPWKGGLQQSRPVRWATDASLTGYRLKVPDPEVLWNAARFRATRVLVIRRGVPFGQDWADGDRVECYRVRIGKRFHNDTEASTFTIPLFVYGEDDDAVVQA